MAVAPIELRVTATNLTDKGLNSVNAGLSKLKQSALSLRGILGTLGVGLSGAALVSFLKSSVAEATRAEDQFTRLKTILESTNRSFTAESIRAYADELARTTTVSSSSVLEVSKVLARFSEISDEAFLPAVRVVENLAKVMGTDAASAAQTFGRMINSPLTATRSMTGALVALSTAQVNQIQALVKNQRATEAAALTIQFLQKQLGDQIAIRTFGDLLVHTSNMFDEFRERLGMVITTSSVFRGFLAQLAESIDTLFRDPEAFRTFQKAVEDAFLAGIEFIAKFIEGVERAIDNLGGLRKVVDSLQTSFRNFNRIGTGQLPAAVLANVGSEQLDALLKQMDEIEKKGGDLNKIKAEFEKLPSSVLFGRFVAFLESGQVADDAVTAFKKLLDAAQPALNKQAEEAGKSTGSAFVDAMLKFVAESRAKQEAAAAAPAPSVPGKSELSIEDQNAINAAIAKITELKGKLAALALPEGYVRQVAEINAHYQSQIAATKSIVNDQQRGLAQTAAQLEKQIALTDAAEKYALALNKSAIEAQGLVRAMGVLKVPEGFTRDVAEIEAAFATAIEQAELIEDVNQRAQTIQLATLNLQLALLKRVSAAEEQRQGLLAKSIIAQEKAGSSAQVDLQRQFDAFENFQRGIQQAGTDTTVIDAVVATYARALEEIQRAKTATGQLADIMTTTAGQAIKNFGEGMAETFTNFILGAKNAGQSFRQFAAQFLASIAQMIVQALVLLAITQALRQWGGSIGGAIADIIVPPRTAGGGITTGPTFALVGDNPSGKEMIVPLERADQMGFGGRGDINTTVIVQTTGATAVQSDARGAGRQFSKLLESEITRLILREQRPGGLLATVRQ